MSALAIMIAAGLALSAACIGAVWYCGRTAVDVGRGIRRWGK